MQSRSSDNDFNSKIKKYIRKNSTDTKILGVY